MSSLYPFLFGAMSAGVCLCPSLFGAGAYSLVPSLIKDNHLIELGVMVRRLSCSIDYWPLKLTLLVEASLLFSSSVSMKSLCSLVSLTVRFDPG